MPVYVQRANEERHIRPWILVSGHRPIYTAQMATSDGQVTGYCRPMQKAFEDLLYKVTRARGCLVWQGEGEEG